jgi:hypothetical protein
MDLTNNKPIIISVGVNGWYPAGIDRLERSLIMHGYAGDYRFWKNEYPLLSPSHEENPYAFKIYAFEEAIAMGKKIILFLDSSFWCIKTPHEIFDIINDNGVFGFRTGYNCAETCSDAALQWAGFSRDEAEKLPEIASGMVGLNMDNPNGKRVYELWKQGCEFGLFKNNRIKDPLDSTDYRFIHARQDQSIWSLAIHMVGLDINYTDYCSYYGTGYDPDKCLFFINGL